MRKHLFAAAVLLLLQSITMWGQDVQREIGMASAAVGRAIASSDFASLEKLWSPQFIVNSPSNRVITREQVFAAIRRGELKYTDYDTTVEHMDVFGDVATVMGHETYRPTFGPEKGVLLHRRFTNVWQKTAGGWVMIARQASIIDPTQTHY